MKIESYISNPNWNNSFVGRFLWIYKGRGILDFTNDTLIYFDEQEQRISKDKIIDMTLGRYHRTAKPIKLNYIEIKHRDEDSLEKSVFFTPIMPKKNPWLTSVWGTNKYVKKRLEEIIEWKNS